MYRDRSQCAWKDPCSCIFNQEVFLFDPLDALLTLPGQGQMDRIFSSCRSRRTRPNQRSDACQSTYSGAAEIFLDSNELLCCFFRLYSLAFRKPWLHFLWHLRFACWRRTASRSYLEHPINLHAPLPKFGFCWWRARMILRAC